MREIFTIAIFQSFFSLTVLVHNPGGSNRIGPSRVCALPLGVAAERSVHYFGPSGVCALPLHVAVEGSVHFN